MARRCVVTGIGIVSPVGTGKDAFWKSLVEGATGIGEITYFDTSNLPMGYAGEVKGFDTCISPSARPRWPWSTRESRLRATARFAGD